MSIKKIIGANTYERIRNLSILLVFGNLLYHLFPFPPLIWRISLVALAIPCYLLNDKRTKLERSLFVFIIVDLLYFFFALALRKPGTTTIGNTMSAFSTLFIFSFLNRKGVLTDSFITTASIILFIGCIGYYLHFQNSVMERIGDNSNESVTINASSVFLFLIPLLFYIKKRWISSSILFLSLLFIFTAVKRGNIVAVILPAFLFIIYNFSESKRSLSSAFIFFFILIISSQYLLNSMLENDFFMYRLQETLAGNSSGREVIYRNALDAWGSSSLLHAIIGNGYDSTLSLIGIHAHNDWLEILVDFGVLGLLFYLVIFVVLFSNYKHSTLKIHKYVLLSCISIWFIKSLISMAYIETWMMIMMLPLAVAISSKPAIEE